MGDDLMYGADLADIYDAVYASRGKDYPAEAQQVAELIHARQPAAASLLDVGCATGAHLASFRRLFPRVAGVELSPPMVAAANRRLGTELVCQGDMRDFDLGRTFDAIICMFGTIGHALTEPELVATLRSFRRHLAPAGVVVVDPWWFPETFRAGYVVGDVCQDGTRTVARVSHAAREQDRSRMTVHYVVAEAAGIRHFAETYLARLFTRAEYERAFRSAGLAPRYLPGLHSGRGVFVAVAADDSHRPQEGSDP